MDKLNRCRFIFSKLNHSSLAKTPGGLGEGGTTELSRERQILEDYVWKGNYYKMSKGDSINISVQNEDISEYSILTNLLLGMKEYSIFAEYGGLIKNESY